MFTVTKHHEPLADEYAAQHFLRGAEQWIERLAPAGVVVLLLLFSIWAWLSSHSLVFQFDELLEVSAATAPTGSQVLSTLASGVDFNPPLSHFLVRGSQSLFGNSEWAARFPAFLGFAILLLCLYTLLARQLSRSYGLMAMLLLLCLPVRHYAIQARPYGIVLGLSGVAVLLFGAAVHRNRRPFVLPALAICTMALVASHYYAVLVVGVLVATELILAWRRARLDWALLACCAVPPLAVLWLLRNAIRQQREVLTHYFSRGNLLSFNHGFDELLVDPLISSIALLLLVGALALRWTKVEPLQPARMKSGLSMDVMILSLNLFLLPIVGSFITQFVTHAYVPRYFLPAAIGFCICLCHATKALSRTVPYLVLILLTSLSLGFGNAMMQEISRKPEPIPSVQTLTAEAPLLFDTPATYEQVYYYRPSLRDNIWVIADPVASLRYRQYDTDDRIMLALAARGRAQAISLSAAVRRWPHFRLIPRSADSVWALKCLLDSRSQVQVQQTFGSSNFIFDVQVHPESIPRIDACAIP